MDLSSGSSYDQTNEVSMMREADRRVSIMEHEQGHEHGAIPLDGQALEDAMNEDDHSYDSVTGRMKRRRRRTSMNRPRKIRTPRRQRLDITSLTDSIDSEDKRLKRLPQCDLYDWNGHYAALLQYYAEYGHCNVPFKTTYECILPGMSEDGSDLVYLGNLGRWLDRQRQTKKGNRPETLRPEREALLQQLVEEGKLQWVAQQKKDGWQRSYLALLEYCKIYGHCNVPAKATFECDLPDIADPRLRHYSGNLGTWVEHQRQSKKGKGTRLFPEREALLQQLVDEGKFLWDASEFSSSSLSRHNYELQWPLHYAALLEYCKEHGHCNVPINEFYECELPGENGQSGQHYSGRLGRWLQSQRMARRGSSHSASLTHEREGLLQILVDEGKLWWDSSTPREAEPEPRNELSFIVQYAALLEYGKEHGDCNIPRNSTYECILTTFSGPNLQVTYTGDLGAWLQRQRQARKGYGGKLSTERRGLLQRLVSEGKLVWDNTTESLTNNNNVNNGQETGYCAPVSVNEHYDQHWQRHYAALLEYGKEHGHCNVPIGVMYHCTLPDGSRFQGHLGVWLFSQRLSKSGFRNRPPLLPEREAQLQTLVNEGKLVWEEGPGSTNVTDITDANWPRHFAALLEYAKEHGHCNVPPQASYECVLPATGILGKSMRYKGDLGVWLTHQKRAKRVLDPSLCPERDALLQQLVDEGQLSWDISPEVASLSTIELERARWMIHAAALTEYSRQHGHCSLLFGDSYECDLTDISGERFRVKYVGNLGQWLTEQRLAYLREERASRVQGVLTRRPQPLVLERRNLFRTLISQGLLWIDQTSELDQDVAQTGGTPQATSWFGHYLALLEYGRMNGHCNLPIDTIFECNLPDERGRLFFYLDWLGGWLCRQKLAKYGYGRKLLPEREFLLQQLVDEGRLHWEDTNIVTLMNWNQNYAALLEYGRIHGHCNVPFETVFACMLADGEYQGALGVWLYKQGLAWCNRVEPLSPDQESLLQRLIEDGSLNLEMQTDDIDDSQLQNDNENTAWLMSYGALVEYSKEHGHCDVPYKTNYSCEILWGSALAGQPSRYQGDIGTWLLTQRLARHPQSNLPPLTSEREALLQQLVDQGRMHWEDEKGLVSISDETWTQHYNALIEYRCVHGHCNVPYDLVFECQLSGSSNTYCGLLGVWLYQQRQACAGLRPISPDRQALLRDLSHTGHLNLLLPQTRMDNTRLSISSTTSELLLMNINFWDIHYSALIEYGKEHGNCNIPIKTIYECILPGDDVKHYSGCLGNWLELQRRAKVMNQLSPDLEVRLQKLVDMGQLVWHSTPQGCIETEKLYSWEDHYNALLEYCRQNSGLYSIPDNLVFEYSSAGTNNIYRFRLGRWLNSQMRIRPLDPRLQQLVDQGLLKQDLSDHSWGQNFAALIEFGNIHGHCNVPFDTTFTCMLADGQYQGALGVWLYKLRLAKSGRGEKLSIEQEALLQKLVDEGKLSWVVGLEKMETQIHGRPGMESSVGQGEITWHGHYAALLEYCKEHGHCNVPKQATYECMINEGGSIIRYQGHLGSWLCYQRRLKKKEQSKLQPDREALLQQLVDEGFLQWDISRGKHTQQSSIPWPDHFAALMEYCKEHGHCNVPKKVWYECLLPPTTLSPGKQYCGPLGSWLQAQKQRAKRQLTGTVGATDPHPERAAMLQHLVDEGKMYW